MCRAVRGYGYPGFGGGGGPAVRSAEGSGRLDGFAPGGGGQWKPEECPGAVPSHGFVFGGWVGKSGTMLSGVFASESPSGGLFMVGSAGDVGEDGGGDCTGHDSPRGFMSG